VAHYLVKKQSVEGISANELLDARKYEGLAASSSFNQLINEVSTLRTLKSNCQHIVKECVQEGVQASEYNAHFNAKMIGNRMADDELRIIQTM